MRCKGVSGSAFLTNRLLEQYNKHLEFKAIKLSDFKMDLTKWQLNFVSCNFVLFTRMISDQIALHSVQLPLLIKPFCVLFRKHNERTPERNTVLHFLPIQTYCQLQCIANTNVQ